MDVSPPSNPFKAFTEERKLYNNITKAISFYQNSDYDDFIDESLVLADCLGYIILYRVSLYMIALSQSNVYCSMRLALNVTRVNH